MALSIHLLDQGDIELKCSFRVLGHDRGRVRRVPVYWVLIRGGQHPIVVDTGHRDHGNSRHAGLAVPQDYD